MFVLTRTIFSIILIVAVAQAQVGIFDSDGKKFAKVARTTQQPKVIVDTVNISDGWGYLGLMANFDRSANRVAPTNSDNIFAVITPLLADTTATVYYYGYTPTPSGDTLKIKSSGGASDDGKVIVILYTK